MRIFPLALFVASVVAGPITADPLGLAPHMDLQNAVTSCPSFNEHSKLNSNCQTIDDVSAKVSLVKGPSTMVGDPFAPPSPKAPGSASALLPSPQLSLSAAQSIVVTLTMIGDGTVEPPLATVSVMPTQAAASNTAMATTLNTSTASETTQDIVSSTISATESTSPSAAAEEQGLPGTTIAGIVVGTLAGVSAIALILFVLCRRRSRQRGVTEKHKLGDAGTHPDRKDSIGLKVNEDDATKIRGRTSEIDGTSSIQPKSFTQQAGEKELPLALQEVQARSELEEYPNQHNFPYSPSAITPPSQRASMPPLSTAVGIELSARPASQLQSQATDFVTPVQQTYIPATPFEDASPSPPFTITPTPTSPIFTTPAPEAQGSMIKRKSTPASLDAAVAMSTGSTATTEVDEDLKKSSKLSHLAGPYLTADRALGEGYWEAEREQLAADQRLKKEEAVELASVIGGAEMEGKATVENDGDVFNDGHKKDVKSME